MLQAMMKHLNFKIVIGFASENIFVYLSYCFYFYIKLKTQIMGKGDKRSKRGKIHIGTFGRLRPRKKKSAAKSTAKAAPKKTKKAKK